MLALPGPIILDLNTQRDLLSADGIYPIFQPERLYDPLKQLFAIAHRHQIPVVSTRFHHLMAPACNTSRDHGTSRLICQPTASGYQKMPFTQLRRRIEWPLDCGTDLPVDGFRVIQQYIFDLPSLNLFESPRLDRLLSETSAQVFLVAGVPLEWTVRTAVLGLLARRHKVAVVSDCIGMWDPYEGDMALRQVESKNIEWLTVAQVAERYGSPKPRSSRVARVRARATQGNVTSKSPKARGAFRL